MPKTIFPSDSQALARRDQDVAWLRAQLAPAREPLSRLGAVLPSDEPITTPDDADMRANSIKASEQALADIESHVAPIRSRIHALRTELARRVKLATGEPLDRIAQAKRVLGAWRARERTRKQAAAAAGRMKAARAETLADAADAVTEAPEPSGPKGTRLQWRLEVTDADALRRSLVGLVLARYGDIRDARTTDTRKRLHQKGDAPASAAALTDALVIHEPTLRKALASAEGAHVADLAGLEGLRIYSEDVAT